jgi:hypothetical protein
MGLLDIYNNGGTELNQITYDYVTQYSPNNSGTPTNTQNPGGPVQNFTQKYSSEVPYVGLNPVAVSGSGELENTLDITNFDVENPSVQGGPLNDTTTVYPAANVTHTSPIRGWFAEPSEPPSNFIQSFTPTNTYEDFISKP